ncbi:MAG: hypothetical protein ACXAEN_18740 [Candidatus Thorarchaeota archaeon]|jgi:hypothetical protein
MTKQLAIVDFQQDKENEPLILKTAQEDLSKVPDAQIITRRVSVEKLTTNGAGRYYNRVKSDLRSKIDSKKETYILFIPDVEIEERWIVRTLLTLQRELTHNIVIPPTTVGLDDFEEWISYFRPKRVLCLD